LLTLVLSAQSTLHNGLILVAFVLTAVVVAVVALRSSERTLPLFAETLESSSQLAVRMILLLVFALATLAYKLGLDLVLGGFAAGMITRQLLKERELPAFDSKLRAVGFGVFIPFFFVVSGMKLDISALAHPSGIAKLALFFVLFLVVRGTPAMLLYRKVLEQRQRIALALLSSTQLSDGRRNRGCGSRQRPHATVACYRAGRRGRNLDSRLSDPWPARQRFAGSARAEAGD
jgi:Kef-type K+ transport system membrane component KefB